MLVIEFLRRVYEGQTEDLVAEEEQEQLWREIRHSFVASQVYHLLRSRGLLDNIPRSLRERLKTAADEVLFSNLLIRGEMNKLLQLLEKAEVPVIPLKGILFSERYFGHFAARGTSDIDLLIPPTQLEKVAGLLTESGFIRDGEEDATHFHSLFMKNYENDKFPFLSVEVHWDVLRSNISATHIEQFWDRAVPYGAYNCIRELPVDQTFYHICLHGFHHHLLGMKYILDICHLLFTRTDDIDLARILEQADRDRNFVKVLIVLTHVYDLFPSLNHVKPLPSIRRWPFWSLKLLDKGVLTNKGPRYYLFRTLVSVVTYDTWEQKFADIRYSWFPPREFALSMVKADPRTPFYKVYGKLYWNRLQRIHKSRLSKVKL